MNEFDLTMNNDYYIPLTKKEMIEKLEYYKALTVSLDKKMNIKSNEYYELLDSLINLEISAFDISFASYVTIPNILRDVLKYNVWHKTMNVVNNFNNKNIVLSKEPEKHGYVKVYKSVISDISLKPSYAFTQPSIIINSYEMNYEIAKNKMLELRSKYDKLKNEQKKCRLEELYSEHITEEQKEELEKILERHIELNEEIESVRKLLNFYRKNLCLYKDGIYKEVVNALLEEYHIPYEEGKDYVKKLPWITLTKKSL